MARIARKKSSTGVYHILLRGIDKRDIFLDNKDKEKFIEYLIRAKEKGNFKLYAYCLMDNHVHLLIKEGEEIGTSIKRIAVGYVGWHNKKYERTGHLFQNRFRSEVVETETYLLTVLRYIYQNPVKAGIAKSPGQYPWSTYNQQINAYLNKQSVFSSLDSKFIKKYFFTKTEFINFINAVNDYECLEYKNVIKYNQDSFRKIINKKYNIENLINLPEVERNAIIDKIYKELGISIRQLSKALGVGKFIVEKAIRENKDRGV